jgi:hypothetical protein
MVKQKTFLKKLGTTELTRKHLIVALSSDMSQQRVPLSKATPTVLTNVRLLLRMDPDMTDQITLPTKRPTTF